MTHIYQRPEILAVCNRSHCILILNNAIVLNNAVAAQRTSLVTIILAAVVLVLIDVT